MTGRRAARPRVSFGLALFTLALLPRLYVAIAWGGEPVWDGHYYDFGARRIAEGLGYSDDLTIAGHLVWHPWCHYPVGYSAALSLFYRLLGMGNAVAPVFNAVTGAGLAVITWQLARTGLSETRASVAGLLVALHPGLVLYSSLLMTEPLAALLTLTSFWVAVRDTCVARGLVLGALMLGIAALVRPQALLCAPFLSLVIVQKGTETTTDAARTASESQTWFSFFRRPRLRLASAAFVACAVAVVPVLPWTIRNCRVMDGCALISTNAGWNLAIGAFPRATGRFETLRSSDGCREVTGQVQQDRCWLQFGMDQIRANPARWLGLIPKKLSYTFDHESFAVEYLHEASPAAWPEARRVAYRALTTAAHRILVCAAALGVIAIRRRGAGAMVHGGLLLVVTSLLFVATTGEGWFWPLVVVSSIVPWLPLPGKASWSAGLLLPVAFLGTTVLTHAVFFGEDRYHVVVTPVLCILAAAGLRAGPRPRRDSKATLLAATT